MADNVTEATHTEVGTAGTAPHAEPAALGFDATMLVALSMLVVLAVMAWKKVPAAIGRSLDAKIATIREQLAEAEALRKEAEALKAEYQGKAEAAETESAAMIERAHHESEAILAKARSDAEELVARRGRMAEDKIAAAERSALQELRATAADAAARAAARLIAERHDAAADAWLVDQSIREVVGR